MLPLLLLTLLLAAPGLNGDLIWFDELTSISHAGGVSGPFSALEIADSVQTHSPKHTPLFFEILALWGSLMPAGIRSSCARCRSSVGCWLWRGSIAWAQILSMRGREYTHVCCWL